MVMSSQEEDCLVKKRGKLRATLPYLFCLPNTPQEGHTKTQGLFQYN